MRRLARAEPGAGSRSPRRARGTARFPTGPARWARQGVPVAGAPAWLGRGRRSPRRKYPGRQAALPSGGPARAEGRARRGGGPGPQQAAGRRDRRAICVHHVGEDQRHQSADRPGARQCTRRQPATGADRVLGFALQRRGPGCSADRRGYVPDILHPRRRQLRMLLPQAAGRTQPTSRHTSKLHKAKLIPFLKETPGIVSGVSVAQQIERRAPTLVTGGPRPD